MTNDQHDLSLLTDEEREIANRFSNRNNLGDGVPNFLLRALIAARAENRRKDERIAKLRHEAKIALDFLHDWEASDFQAADEGVQSSFYMTVGGLRRALLQSEKERCPVHDFELPCLGCAELASHVGVDEQEQSEKGGE